jgi:uncharacterized membrane protein YgcG
VSEVDAGHNQGARQQLGESKEVAFYGAVVNAWITTKMEKDKSLLTLSSAGIGLLVTLLTTVGPRSWIEALFYALSFVAFATSGLTAIAIFEVNGDYLQKLSQDADISDPRLRSLDQRLLCSFNMGVLFAALIGVVGATEKYKSGELAMSKKPEPSQAPVPIQKSLDNLNSLKPSQGDKTTASFDGLNKLKNNGGGSGGQGGSGAGSNGSGGGSAPKK